MPHSDERRSELNAVGTRSPSAFGPWAHDNGVWRSTSTFKPCSTARAACVLAAFSVLLSARGAELAPLPQANGGTTLVLLPDTQQYTKSRPQYFEAQCRWIASNQASRRIAYVLSLGDITEHNLPAEWEIAKRSYGQLDGLVPYALIPGNHDYSGGGRDTLLSRYFPVNEAKKWPTFGAVFEEGRLDNSYHLFEINGRPWIAVALEFGPRNEVVAWADGILTKYAERPAIIATHAYLFHDNVLYDHTKGAQRASPHDMGNDGEELWQKLIRRHANVMLVVCGHVRSGGLGYLASEGDHGNTVHQILTDYEALHGNGAGYLRLLEFPPDGKTVNVKAYSPVLDRWMTDPSNQFTITLKQATETNRTVSLSKAGETAERLDKGRWNRVGVRTVADLKEFHPGHVDLSKYGGLASTGKLHVTGFFHTERIGHRWTLVDPEGCPFISVGLCSVNLGSFPGDAVTNRFGGSLRWAEHTAGMLRECGFNTLGRWSDGAAFRKLDSPMAYTTALSFMASYDKQRSPTNGARHYPGRTIPVFDKEFPEFCNAYARSLAATKDDPWLLGHFSDNELPFRPEALSCYLGLPPTDPGHRAAVQWLESRRKTVGDITAADQLDFLATVADRYYSAVRTAIRRYDPHHLYLGSRLNGRNINDGTFRGSRAVDVVSINMYHEWSLNEDMVNRCAELSQRPVLNSEWYAMQLAAADVAAGGAGFRVRSQRDRGLFYQNLCLGMLGNPNIVGWHWFKYSGDASDQSRGFVDVSFEPHRPMTDLMRELNTRVYTLRTLLTH